MPYNIEWVIPNHVASITTSGELSLEDVKAFTQISYNDFLKDSDVKVHFIGYFGSMNRFPTQLSQIRQIALPFLNHPNLGVFIMVGGDNAMLQFITRTVAQLVKVEFYMATSTEEALERIKRLDPLVSGIQ